MAFHPNQHDYLVVATSAKLQAVKTVPKLSLSQEPLETFSKSSKKAAKKGKGSNANAPVKLSVGTNSKTKPTLI